jgi:hypothetical protein
MSYLRWLPAVALCAAVRTPAQFVLPQTPLPDSPGYVWNSSLSQQSSPAGGPQIDLQQPPGQAQIANASQVPVPCPANNNRASVTPGAQAGQPCAPFQIQNRPFVDANRAILPLTAAKKFRLAIHDIKDPFNLLTIAGTSAYTIGSDSHTAYGPGMRGFGYNASVSLSQDITGELIGTYAVCALFRQDPRYFRMPHKPFGRRLVHAVSHIVVAQGDNGKPIFNFENFITPGAMAVIGNLYVPGLATDPTSTTERIFSGFITEPIGLLIAEFLPDVASHVHVNIVILQRYINQIAAQQSSGQQTPVP